MECPNCGTWNPDDKAKCWRCSEVLPTPPKPRKSRKISSQTWLWIIAILFALFTLFTQCRLGGGGGGDDETGFRLVPTVDLPGICWELQESEAGPVALRVGGLVFRSTVPVSSLL